MHDQKGDVSVYVKRPFFFLKLKQKLSFLIFMAEKDMLTITSDNLFLLSGIQNHKTFIAEHSFSHTFSEKFHRKQY